MIVKALVDFLQANSSINIVVADGGTNENISESLNAYVLVSELSNYGSARHANATTTRIAIRACFPKDYQIDLDRYILFELHTLLHKKILTIVNGDTETKVQLYVTSDISPILHSNADGLIARERIVLIPSIWR